MAEGNEKRKSFSLSRHWTPKDMHQQSQSPPQSPPPPKEKIKKGRRSFNMKFLQTKPTITVPQEIQDLKPIITTPDGSVYPLERQHLSVVSELGRGAYGVVERCRHAPSDLHIAVKRIVLGVDAVERRRLLTDLEVNAKLRRCPEACFFYGAAYDEGQVLICMELMDASMDNFYKKSFALGLNMPEDYLVHIALSVIKGLIYLYANLKVMHRDVKPSNILINKSAAVKVCDFGVSAVMINSLAPTNIGCKPYMAPERLDMDVTKGFTAKSDVWSLGVTLVEVGDGRFPYDSQSWNTPFDQMKQVFERPPPTFSNAEYSAEVRAWTSLMLQKRPEDRADYETLIKDAYVEGKRRCMGREEAKKGLVDWVGKVIDAL